MSPVYGQGSDVTIVAGADLSGQQYKPVNVSGVLATSADNVFGILQNKPQAGEHATVRWHGFSKAYMSCSLGLGALVMGSNATSGFLALQTSGYQAFGEVFIAANSGDYGTLKLYGGPVRRSLA